MTRWSAQRSIRWRSAEHGIDRAHEQRRREYHERHEIEDASHRSARTTYSLFAHDLIRKPGPTFRDHTRSALRQPVELDQRAQQRLHLLQRHHVGAVGRRAIWILMGLDEHT